MITEQQLQEFKAIWLEEFGTTLTDEEAMSEAIALLNFFEAVLFKGNGRGVCTTGQTRRPVN